IIQQMRTSHAFLAVASLLAVLSGLTVSTIMEGGSDAHSRAPQFQSPSPEDYTVFPESEGWTNDNRPIVSVTLHRDDYEVDVKSSIFRLDGDSVQPMWDWMNRTLWMRPSTSLEDGSHEVDFSVADVQGSFINTTWTFFVDTSNPVVFITPLPATVPERDITIAGEVEEGNLASLTVNGEPASVDPQGEFEKLVVLWPGMNDINVTAIDYAGNRGTSVSHVAWEPSDGTPVVLEEVSHANSSFSIRLPTDWTIRIDPLLV
ncbi:MAG: hypothetical protein GTO49_26175, partial [Anaerolineae bacterium]|nr:hypothetical protein [Anaerolineae bacterium]